MRAYTIVPAMARPRVAPRLRMKLRCVVSFWGMMGERGGGDVLAPGGHDGHVAALDAGLDGDEGTVAGRTWDVSSGCVVLGDEAGLLYGCRVLPTPRPVRMA